MVDFNPRFVDLVRNYTTTVGTGDFTLGPAVNGFAGLADALSVGDQFYYSCIGVDKPAEREVGRGTLIAGGKIERQPMSGATTIFTSGSKAIALVAAAEWFSDVQAAAGGLQKAADQAALAALGTSAPALLTDAGRSGLFVFDGSDLSAKVGADPLQGLHVAPSSDPSGASGAWVRRHSGAVNVKWFGAVGDGTTDDHPAFAAAIDVLYPEGGSIFVPKGNYRLSQRLEFKTAIHFHGEGIGRNAGFVGEVAYPFPTFNYGSTLLFDVGVAGLLCYFVTDVTDAAAFNADPDTAKYKFPGAGGTLIERLRFLSAGDGAILSSAIGIESRAPITIRNCEVRGFGDDGVRVIGSVSGGDGVYLGNVNGSAFENLQLIQNGGDGIAVGGNDANEMLFSNVQTLGNYGYGFDDDGFIGNVYVKCLTEGNEGGRFRNSRISASNTYIGCHNEQDGGENSLTDGQTVLGGNMAQNSSHPADSTAFVMSGGIASRRGYRHVNYKSTPVMGSQLGSKDGTGGVFAWGQEDATNFSEWKFIYNPRGTAGHWGPRYAGSSGTVSYMIPDGTTNSGRSYAIEFPRGICIGDLSGNQDKLWRLGSAAPTTGTYVQGDMVWSRTPAAGGVMAWRCVTGGTPGTWEALSVPTGSDLTLAGNLSAGTDSGNAHSFNGLITAWHGLKIRGGNSIQLQNVGNSLTASIAYDGTNITASKPVSVTGAILATGVIGGSGGIGYPAGLGGAVTQATSKSTGVTLNKLAGQVTMNAAALAAAAIVEFTVTNNQVAATDTINLNLASGAASGIAYRYWISAVAAGSFKIAVENRSGGSLSEAAVLSFAVVKGVNA